MDINQCFPGGAYLKAADIAAGQTIKVMIDGVVSESPAEGEAPKPVLRFVGKEKGLVLNKTNAATISSAYGPETDQWTGKAVELFQATTQFNGSMVPCIRLRPVAGAPPAEATKEADVPF